MTPASPSDQPSNPHQPPAPTPVPHPPQQRWIAYQLLLALAQAHGRGVCHGDVKPENVALTSWDWAFLVDFAPYKPTLLPADNPADFSLFFDTSGKRKCYLAPERFYDPGQGITPAQAATAPLTPAMVRPPAARGWWGGRLGAGDRGRLTSCRALLLLPAVRPCCHGHPPAPWACRLSRSHPPSSFPSCSTMPSLPPGRFLPGLCAGGAVS